jgi:hypothetical protein
MNDTQLIFIVGSGRCGTKAIAKMFTGAEGIEAHHEYCRYAYQREAVLYAMHRLGRELIEPRLDGIFGSAAHYSDEPIFLDSSHKTVWVVDVLSDMYPTAKFVHVVRDGRKVVSSFYHKLNLHNDRAHNIFMNWYDYPGRTPIPSPSEAFWMTPYRYDVERFERVCLHWVDTNETILRNVPEDRKLLIRLEDLTSNFTKVKQLADFIGTEYKEVYYEMLQHTDHVYVPINYEITDEQRKTFNRIAGGMMEQFGYDINEKEYHVSYKM